MLSRLLLGQMATLYLVSTVLDKCIDCQSTNFSGVPRGQDIIQWVNGLPFTHYEKTVLPVQVLQTPHARFKCCQRHTPELHDHCSMLNAQVVPQVMTWGTTWPTLGEIVHQQLAPFIPNPNTSLFKSIAWTGCMSKSNSAALHLPLPSLPVVLLSLSHCASSRADRKSQVRQFWVCVQLIHRQR